MRSKDRKTFAAVCFGLTTVALLALSADSLHVSTDWLVWLGMGAFGFGMVAQATYLKDSSTVNIVLTAAVTGGDVIQLPDGRAGVVLGLSGANHAIGDTVACQVSGLHTVAKTASVVLLDGGRAWFDHSANSATYAKANDRDFFLGTIRGDAASAATTVVVDLNVQPCWAIDLLRDPFDSVVVKTAGTPALRYLGGAFSLEFSATAEAQKIDAFSKDKIAAGVPFIADFAIEVVDGGDAAAMDFNIGVANETHASDADTIAESVFAHLDGASANINCESDDGTTQVAATDSTVDYTAGTRFHFTIDGRDDTNVKLYLNGARVLSGSTFKLDAASGPIGLLAHLEKSSDDTAGEVHIDFAALRLMEQVTN